MIFIPAQAHYSGTCLEVNCGTQGGPQRQTSIMQREYHTSFAIIQSKINLTLISYGLPFQGKANKPLFYRFLKSTFYSLIVIWQVSDFETVPIFNASTLSQGDTYNFTFTKPQFNY